LDAKGKKQLASDLSRWEQIVEAFGEFDHWLPHWMGGSTARRISGLSLYAGKFGSRVKDKVELLLWRQVCVDKTMTLIQARKQYLQGWTKLVPTKK
jgi:hypothetical protein